MTVRSGYGEATGKGAAVRVNSGQQVRFNGGTSLAHTAMERSSRATALTIGSRSATSGSTILFPRVTFRRA